LKGVDIGDIVYLVDYSGDSVELKKPVVVKSFDAAQRVFENTCRWKYEEVKKTDKSVKAINDQLYGKKIYYSEKFISIKIIKIKVS